MQNTMRKPLWIILTVVLAAVMAPGASADSIITFVTPSGATTSGGPVDASATFVTNADGTLDITLTDLQANPTDVAQLLSDLSFVLSNGATSGTIASSSGQEITVNSGGTFTTGSIVDTGWVLNSTAVGLQLDVLGTPTAPSHLIIGPPDGGGTYSNANGSIAGNGPHNPFLNGSATFILDIPGVTDATTITSATFSFGTTEGADLVPGTTSVPEPSSLTLLLVAVVVGGMVLVLRKRLGGLSMRCI
jgi:hypothetical protein